MPFGISPRFNAKFPKNAGSFFLRESDNEFKRVHPIAYVILAIFGLIALFGPCIVFALLNYVFTLEQSAWTLLEYIGAFIIGIGLFNLVAAWLNQYLGHAVTIVCLSLGFILALMGFFGMLSSNEGIFYNWAKADRYTQVIQNSLQKGESISLGEVFTFDFATAYVVEDSYISGIQMNEKHGFQLDINSIKSVETDAIRRIVFFDDQGKLVYEYRYMVDKLFALQEGFMIRTGTILSPVDSPDTEDGEWFRFIGTEPVPGAS